ncbi:MAG TPA: type II toxin-antitoxin system prevent-host-death family antitoxin [Mycobacteriales bacterium]|nr:type II toxin-antitoxin system prevent-host-death family antitoxin [Mycobacteriales bacterium]
MEVAISSLRADLASWVDRARSGEEVVVTDRGVPVARLIPIDTAPIIARLTREGLLGRSPQRDKPTATGRRRAPTKGPVADLVTDQRR